MSGSLAGQLSVGVMGAGSVGSYFGALLGEAGANVVLVTRNAHAQAINHGGLAIDSVNGDRLVRLRAATDAAALADADIVLVAVKSGDTETVADLMAPKLHPAALVVSLQNGVDNAWRLRARMANAVVPAAVYVSTEMRGPGRVRHNGGGRIIVGQPLAPTEGVVAADERLGGLVALLGQAGVPCERSADIRIDLWTKLASNCAYNAISALSGLRYGRIVSSDAARTLMRDVTDELIAVGQADGVPLDPDSVRAAVWQIAEVMPGALSSTAQDLQAGRRTEIDDLNGFVVRRGLAVGVPTPLNRTLQVMVKLAERAKDP